MSDIATRQYRVEGLTCVDCARRLRVAVGQVQGVESSQADHATGMLTVSLSAPDLPAERIAEAVRSAGFNLADGQSSQAKPAAGFIRFVFSRRETTWAAVAAIVTLAGLVLSLAGAPVWSRTAAFGAAIALGGAPLARYAWQEVRLSRSLGINALMVIAVAGAVFIGEWAEAAIVVVLFSLGEALEGFAAERSREALRGLLDLAPPMALKLLPSGETSEVAVDHLVIGDRVLVRPGDRVSVDGTVVAGQSAVDQAPITGESMVVDKRLGDEVYAGTINTSGALQVEVSRLAADNTLSRMVDLVQQAQSPRIYARSGGGRAYGGHHSAPVLPATIHGRQGLADAGTPDAGHRLSLCTGHQYTCEPCQCHDQRCVPWGADQGGARTGCIESGEGFRLR